jgi:hypothetical protein
LDVDLLFRRVRADVLLDTSGKQRPQSVGTLTGEVMFKAAR